ncbi:hypothetical protein KKA23_03165 [Patescibacteria group bacterium]|nr:hypothetical protein [Patescibacteria group bacterium]
MNNKKFKEQDINFEQIERFLEGAQKKINSSKKVLLIDQELSYQTAYEAMIKASLALMLSFGKRPRSLPGHYVAIIDFIENKLDKKHKELIGLFDDMRKKRNKFIYEDISFISQYETEQSIKIAIKFIDIIRKKIHETHPQKKLL